MLHFTALGSTNQILPSQLIININLILKRRKCKNNLNSHTFSLICDLANCFPEL